MACLQLYLYPDFYKGCRNNTYMQTDKFGLDLLGVEALEEIDEEIEHRMEIYLESKAKTMKELALLKINSLTDINFKITRKLKQKGRKEAV